MNSLLSTNNHSCDVAGLKYVYPVLSRRMGGLSIGINFNTNNACNWRCIYCQVPNLSLGAAPEMDFQLLEEELQLFLDSVQLGDFYDRFRVDEDKRIIKDIAIAGNGEPTSLKDFAKAVELIGHIATNAGVLPLSKYVLITNGSLVHKANVQEGLKILKDYGGEVWFKLDSATKEGRHLINNTAQSIQAAMKNLVISANLCPTKLQICLLDYANQGLTQKEKQAFLNFFKTVKSETNIVQIMLYTIARPSLQAEASQLKKLSPEVMNEFSIEIKALGFDVSIS